jgi:uncharacterized protein YabE (DUF348 family)
MKIKLKKQKENSRKNLRFHHLRHPLMIPVATFLVFFFLAIGLFIGISGQTVGATDSRIVELSIDGNQEVIPTTASSVGQLLTRLNITLNPGDVVEPAAATQILTNNFQINIYRVHPVTVLENDQKQVVLTASTDIRQIAQQAGLTVYPQDYVTENTSAPAITQNVLGEEITVVPATPVSLDLYGNEVTIRTHQTTVAGLLASEKIATTGNNVLPAATTPITANMQIIVVPVGHKVISTQQSIPYTTQTVFDAAIPYGTSQVAQAGVNGLELVVYEVSATGTASQTPLQEVVATPPTPEILDEGVAISSCGDNSDQSVSFLKSSNIAPSDYNYANYIICHESHWDPADENSSGCIGLGQSCSEAALEDFCPDWQVDAVCQLNFFNNYVTSHGYGSWEAAYDFWVSHGYW